MSTEKLPYRDAVTFRTSVSAHTARLAVVRPILYAVGQGQLNTIECGRAILTRWRGRFTALRSAGFAAIQDSTRFGRCLNCSPEPIYFTKGSRKFKRFFCGFSQVCPWCYGRDVCRLTSQLVNDDDCAIFPLNIFAKKYCLAFDEDPWSFCAREVASVAKVFTKRRRPFFGGFRSISVAPTDYGWEVRSRVAVLDNLKRIPQKLREHGWRSKRYEKPTRRELSGAVVKLMRYPAELFYCDIARLAKMLNDRPPHFRMSARYGVLRDRKIEDTGTADFAG